MRVTDYISAILTGAAIGLLGRLVLPGRQRIGWFVTFLIGVGAALLGAFLADVLGINDDAGVRLWFLRWDWIVLAIQVTLAVVGVGAANVLTYTKLASNDAPRPRKRTRKRKPRSAASE